jgi:hypothetical protein
MCGLRWTHGFTNALNSTGDPCLGSLSAVRSAVPVAQPFAMGIHQIDPHAPFCLPIDEIRPRLPPCLVHDPQRAKKLPEAIHADVYSTRQDSRDSTSKAAATIASHGLDPIERLHPSSTSGRSPA